MVKRYNFVFGASGAGDNWAKTHCTETAQLSNAEVESRDCERGFEIRHLRGDTGSGLASLLLIKLIKMRDNCCDRIKSPKVSDVVGEAYNTRLSIDQLLENSATFVIENGDALKYQQVKYGEIN